MTDNPTDRPSGPADSATERDAYFAQDAAGTPEKEGRFIEVDDLRSVSFTPGLDFRPILGDRVMANFVYFDEHTEAPTHVHDEEQVTVVLEGELEFDLGEERRVLRPGQAAVIPPWVRHGARTRSTRCVEIDIFAPPRAVLVRKLLEDEDQR
ncbi:MAG: cupin domain-containing protein [Streptosporangiaceae bacterium]